MIILDPTVILFQAPTNIASMLREGERILIPKTFVDALLNSEIGYTFIDEVSDFVHYLRPTELVDLILPYLSVYFRREPEFREPFARFQSRMFFMMQSYPIPFADELYESFPSILSGWYSHFRRSILQQISPRRLPEFAWGEPKLIKELEYRYEVKSIFDDIRNSLPKLLGQIVLEELSFLMTHSAVLFRTKLMFRILWQKTRLLIAEFSSKALDFILKSISKLDEFTQKIRDKKRELIDRYKLRGIIWIAGILLWWKTGLPILALKDP